MLGPTHCEMCLKKTESLALWFDWQLCPPCWHEQNGKPRLPKAAPAPSALDRSELQEKGFTRGRMYEDGSFRWTCTRAHAVKLRQLHNHAERLLMEAEATQDFHKIAKAREAIALLLSALPAGLLSAAASFSGDEEKGGEQ